MCENGTNTDCDSLDDEIVKRNGLDLFVGCTDASKSDPVKQMLNKVGIKDYTGEICFCGRDSCNDAHEYKFSYLLHFLLMLLLYALLK